MRVSLFALFYGFFAATAFSQSPWPIRTDTVNVFPPLRKLEGVWSWSNGNETLTFYLKTGVITHAGRIQVEQLLGNHVFLKDGKQADPIRAVSPNPTTESHTIRIGPGEPNLKTTKFNGSVFEESLDKYSRLDIVYDPERSVMRCRLSNTEPLMLRTPKDKPAPPVWHVLPVSFELTKIR